MQHPRLDVHDVLEESSSPLNVGRLAECSHLLVYNILAILKESTHLKCPQRNHKSYKEACLLLTIINYLMELNQNIMNTVLI